MSRRHIRRQRNAPSVAKDAAPLTEAQLKELTRDLHELRKALLNQLEQASTVAQPVDLEQPIGRLSRMDAIQNQQVARANLQALQRRIVMTDAALERAEQQVYGECVACDEPIGYKRLKAAPESSTCIACQRTSEV